MRASLSNKKDAGQPKATCGVNRARHGQDLAAALRPPSTPGPGRSLSSSTTPGLAAAPSSPRTTSSPPLAPTAPDRRDGRRLHNVRLRSSPPGRDLSYNGWTHPSWNTQDLSNDLSPSSKAAQPLEFNEYIALLPARRRAMCPPRLHGGRSPAGASLRLSAGGISCTMGRSSTFFPSSPFRLQRRLRLARTGVVCIDPLEDVALQRRLRRSSDPAGRRQGPRRCLDPGRNRVSSAPIPAARSACPPDSPGLSTHTDWIKSETGMGM